MATTCLEKLCSNLILIETTTERGKEQFSPTYHLSLLFFAIAYLTASTHIFPFGSYKLVITMHSDGPNTDNPETSASKCNTIKAEF